jgi:gamma-D-glutamyl-L-lysine dipeptidyl-peptidase
VTCSQSLRSISRRRCDGLAPLRAAPHEDAEQVTQALPGEPLEVGEERDGWARVRTAYDYTGWVRAEALGHDAAGSWLEAREGDPVEEARAYLGAPYEWGGMTERGIDCSGLVHMAYRRLGRLVPRDADQQEEAGTTVEPDDLRRGDLVCYGDHIAFWLGGGMILHATGREGVCAVVEEQQPPDLAARVRRYVRL